MFCRIKHNKKKKHSSFTDECSGVSKGGLPPVALNQNEILVLSARPKKFWSAKFVGSFYKVASHIQIVTLAKRKSLFQTFPTLWKGCAYIWQV